MKHKSPNKPAHKKIPAKGTATRLALVETLARKFTRILCGEIGADRFALVISRNRDEPNPAVCHSHDFCDANMLMAEAMEAEGINPLPRARKAREAAHELWSEAWDEAKRLMQGETRAGNHGRPASRGVFVALMHGRSTPNEPLSDWGADGPIIGPVELHWTYGRMNLHNVELTDFEELPEVDGLIAYGGKFYGDYDIFTAVPLVAMTPGRELHDFATFKQTLNPDRLRAASAPADRKEGAK